MRSIRCFLLAWLLCSSAVAAEGRVLKVLPHFIDTQGRHTLSPSLYERDAYQAVLRNEPERRAGLRFDIHWKAPGAREVETRLRVELRGLRGNEMTHRVIEAPVRGGRWLATWSELLLTGDEYERLGELNAWRVTVWQGGREIAEERSFLWR